MKKILLIAMLGLAGCGNIQYAPEGIGECQFESQRYYDASKLPIKDIRMTAGYYKGYPHAWVEERNSKGVWEIVDPTQFNSKDKDYKTVHHFGWETLSGENK